MEGYRWIYDVSLSLAFGNGSSDRLGLAPYMVTARALRGAVEIPAVGYFPLLNKLQLFQLFRDVDLEPHSILTFANRYGWIGETGRVDQGDHLWIPAVGLSHWRREIQTMIVAHHLWDCIQANDARTLQNYFTWHPNEFNVQASIGVLGREILAKSHPAMLAADPLSSTITAPFRTFDLWMIDPGNVDPLQALGWKKGYLVGPACLAVMSLVNQRLAEYCHPRLYLGDGSSPIGHLSPVNLLGCIWLQFYLMMIGRLRLCAVCKKEIEVIESRRTRWMHQQCSKSLRQKRWRVKQGKAKQKKETNPQAVE